MILCAKTVMGKGNTSYVGRPRKLYSDNGRTYLTNSGMAQLAIAQLSENQGTDVQKLVDFGRCEVERELIRSIAKHCPHILAPYHDPMKALCVLRIIHVPLLCNAFVNEIADKEEEPTMLLWLGYYGAFYKASERTVWQRVWQTRQIGQDKGGATVSECPIYDYFDDSPDDYKLWMSRYDGWRNSAVASFDFHIAKQTIDVRTLKGEEREAAILGLLKKLNSLPQHFYGHLEATMKSKPRLREIFQRNARRSRYKAKLFRNQEDTWLIEVWPLVLENGWNWLDLAKVYHAKFDISGLTPIKRIETAALSVTSAESDALKDRCRNLRLRIAPRAAKPGRPKKQENGLTTLPRMGIVAMEVNGIGYDWESWILGSP